jgi:hypothetical protein
MESRTLSFVLFLQANEAPVDGDGAMHHSANFEEFAPAEMFFFFSASKPDAVHTRCRVM